MKQKKTISYYFLNFLWTVTSIVPLPLSYLSSKILFYPFYYIVRYRRKVVRKNLTDSFPEKSSCEIIKLEKRFYHFFLDMVFETAKFATISKQGISKRMKFPNIDEVNSILRNGDSISLYMAHYGTWEWVPSMAMHLDKNTIPGQVYKKLKSNAADQLFLVNRRRFGAVNVEMKAFPRWINEQISNHKTSITGYIADQSPKKRESRHYVSFLNHEVTAFLGAEIITKRYGMKAYYLDVTRVKRGYYEARFIELHKEPSSLSDFELTDLYYHHLEKTIIRQPELYLWTHNRFKHSKEKEISS